MTKIQALTFAKLKLLELFQYCRNAGKYLFEKKSYWIKLLFAVCYWSMFMGEIIKYFGSLQQGDTSVPSVAAQLKLAQVLDSATQSVVEDWIETLQSTQEHEKRVALLLKQPRLAGKFSDDKILLYDANPFEQMVALSDFLGQKKIRKTHSFFFSAENDNYIPVQIKPQSVTTMMHAVLGSTRGNHKAPKYTEWAESDPREDDSQSVFIAPLEALEIIRQPNYSAATLLKGNAFETHYVDTEWRYGGEYACVEDKGQARNSPKKQRSAGFNACAILNDWSDHDDPYAEDKIITPPCSFEEYIDKGNIDESDLYVSVGDIMKAAKKAITKDNPEDLTSLMERLTISKIGSVNTPILCDHIASKILPD